MSNDGLNGCAEPLKSAGVEKQRCPICAPRRDRASQMSFRIESDNDARDSVLGGFPDVNGAQ